MIGRDSVILRYDGILDGLLESSPSCLVATGRGAWGGDLIDIITTVYVSYDLTTCILASTLGWGKVGGNDTPAVFAGAQ